MIPVSIDVFRSNPALPEHLAMEIFAPPLLLTTSIFNEFSLPRRRTNWGRNAWRTPKNVCEGGYNEWGSSFFLWPRWQHPCTVHAKSAWPALGRPTYSSFFRRFRFSHCLLNVEYKAIGAQKREFLSKKYYCCRTLEVVPKSYRPKGQPRSTRNEFPIRADFGNSRKHPIWRFKRGKNWQPKEPFYRQRSVIYGNVDAVCVYSEFWSVLCPV